MSGSMKDGRSFGLAADGVRLFVADSEASAVRSAALPGGDGRLQTIVGTGLFDFGDVDGVGDAVRLQHPKGLTFAAGLLYIADTYNHKIRLLDPRTGETSTFLGSGDDGWRDGVDPLFDEPGGVSIAGGQLFIADTNNHVIRVADLAGGETRTLVLVDPDGHLTRRGEEQPYAGKTIFLESQLVSPGENRILLNIQLPPGYKLNNLAPFSVEWSAAAGVTLNSAPFFQETEPTFPLLFTAGVAGDGSLQADIIIYYCEAETESLCLLEQVRLITPVTTDDNGPATITLEHTISLPALP